MSQSHTHDQRGRARLLRNAALTLAIVSASGSPAFAQSEPAAESEDDVLVITGIRGSIQSSIQQKRNATVVADVLSAEDIGDLPALSIGEAIETITGAATHREKGGASEIAIRGLGPFLGYATFNGREATNGSGDRSVNFNQFPSELINTVAIYKTQQADFVEGGISGVIDMKTVQPLDYGKRRILLEGRALYSEYDKKLVDEYGLGKRLTGSYIDQFDLGKLGDLGISVGVQTYDGSNPEELFTSSSTWVACDGAQVVGNTSNCGEVSRAQVAAGTPYYLIPGSRTYRAFVETDERDAVFAAAQWRPHPSLEVKLDIQQSQRTYTEERYDLNFSETRRGVNNREVDETGILRYYTGFSTIESTPTYRIRDEQYEGGGLNLEWAANERLTLSADLSYSMTFRSEMDRQTRLRSDARDIFNVPTAINNQRIPYTFDYRNSDVPQIIVDPRYDLNDPDNFSAAARLRRDENVRENEIEALRLDGDYDLAPSGITSLAFGARFSELRYRDIDDRVEINITDRATIATANQACRQEFPQSDFLDNADGNSVTSWATFDPLCLYRSFLGVEDPGRNSDLRAIGNRDVTERTDAFYLMANYETALAGVPVSGNFGLRYVSTDVESVGLRSGIDVIENGDGTVTLQSTGAFDSLTINHATDYYLPSFNAAFSLQDDLLLRLGLFRAMARPDPSALGAGRTIQLESGTAFASVEDAISTVVANGNPRTEPLLSWNADVSLEYYLNRDSLFSVAVYAKQFEGGYIPGVENETYVIDSASVVVPVVVDQTTDQTSSLFGFELTAAHRFSNLPKPLDGLGFKASYNYADSDYETEDLRLGDVLDPVTGVVEQGIVEPAGIFGLSKHVFSGSLYYEIGPIELQGIYKYRSEYYQKFVGAPSQNRYIRDTGVFDFRARYNVTNSLSLSFEGLNLNDEPRIHDMPILGSLREYNSYGRRFYLGARYRM